MGLPLCLTYRIEMENSASNQSGLPEPIPASELSSSLLQNDAAAVQGEVVNVPTPEDFDDEKGKMNTLEVKHPFCCKCVVLRQSDEGYRRNWIPRYSLCL